ncbi:MAG: hypothetical protein JNM99_19160 [Verrucomicrobiaceae bacterium]|nr:hypothetical protein [Verrucomicrobiaceae bacterium]
MAIFRTYSKSEQACIDAALLCEMGLDAVVVEDRAYGGNILGATSASIRIELPEEQFAEATSLLAEVESATSPPLTESAPLHNVTQQSPTRLRSFLRWLLVYDLMFEVLVACCPALFTPKVPEEVEQYFTSLALSDALWRFAYLSHWPLLGLTMVANALCLGELRIGRTLYACTLGWAIVCMLGPPPPVAGPLFGFFGSLQWTGASIALALMYWSPLAQRFVR